MICFLVILTQSTLTFIANPAGKYDVGIRQIDGHSVEFVGKPRTFCFRGVSHKDERVYVYKVAVDSGFTAEKALAMYNEAKETEVPQAVGRNGWLGRGPRREIVSGFYIDSRDYLSQRPGAYGKKVFLVINPGAHSENCIVIRPNTGRGMMRKATLRNDKIPNWRAEDNVNRALEVWKRE